LAADDPDPKSPGRPNGGGSGFIRQLGDVLDLPFVLVGSVVIGAVVGYFLDRRFGTSPVLTLVLGAAGFASGMYELVRRLTKRKGNG